MRLGTCWIAYIVLKSGTTRRIEKKRVAGLSFASFIGGAEEKKKKKKGKDLMGSSCEGVVQEALQSAGGRG